MYIVWNFKCSHFWGSITRLCRVPVWPGLSQLLQASTLWPSMPPTMASSHSSWWSNETFVVQVGMFPRIPPFWEPGHGQIFSGKPWKPKICGGRRIMEHLEHQSRKSLYMDKWWYMLRFLGNMNNISIFIGFSCISTHERDFTYQPHDRRNALNQDLLKDQLTGMCNTTISIWPSFKASRDVVRQELWEHLGSWNCGGHDHALKLHVQLLRHDQTVDVFSFEHAKTGPENIDVLLFSKRVASCLLSLPHLVHVHHKYHDI